ncbi:MAG: NUDIX domain-containing protein, partial [Candidatus Heimdallarchaeota archaeon]|nr:NUDIX domain-containing protein [Candidatus Heimdallarchaeota archaeon]
VMTLPYYFTSAGDLHVGLISELRPNMGEKLQLCAIGGFKEPGESPEESQTREAEEEAGLDSKKAEKLPGLSLNPNRTFFVADPGKGEGIDVFALEIKEHSLKELLLKEVSIKFLPWEKAVQKSADALTLAAIARLLAMKKIS